MKEEEDDEGIKEEDGIKVIRRSTRNERRSRIRRKGLHSSIVGGADVCNVA